MDATDPAPETQSRPCDQVYALCGASLLLTLIVGVPAQLRSLPAGLALTEAFILLIAVLFVRQKRLALTEAFAWHSVSAGVALRSLILGISAWSAAAALYHLSRSVLGEPPGFTGLAPRSLPDLLMLLLVAAAMPGICEELLFRGAIFGVLQRKTSTKALLISAALFSVYHLNPWNLASAFFLGLILGGLRARTGSIIPAIIAHAATNGTAFSVAYFARDTADEKIAPFLFAAACLIFAAAAFEFHRHTRTMRPARSPLAAVSAGMPQYFWVTCGGLIVLGAGLLVWGLRFYLQKRPSPTTMPAPARSESVHFGIPTRDARTHLQGQIDLPRGDASRRYPTVVIVNGGWFMERDGFMGNSGTDEDLIYRCLAQRLTAAGVAVVRYDNRGVRCNEITMPPCQEGSSEAEISRHYLKCCIDPEARLTVSVQTQMDDVESIWNFARAHPNASPNAMIVIAHSEGGLNVARLISARRVHPLAVIMFGAAAGSPSASLHWQMVTRYAEHLMRWDSDRDGHVTQADVDLHLGTDTFFSAVGIGAEQLRAPLAGWTMALATSHFDKMWLEAKRTALSKPDEAPYPEQQDEFPTIAASQGWWKQWFEDETPMIDHFAAFRGTASFHFGGIDPQAPGALQMEIAESRLKARAFANKPRLMLHERRGHALRTGAPLAGPMDADAMALLVAEVQRVVGHTRP